ncbi:MAG: class I SAM-dependent methyltransferase [Cyanobacteriota bacterium]|jgi:SAM-dependent methyltransferase
MSYLTQFSQDCLRYIPHSKILDKKVLVVGCGNGKDCEPFLDFSEVHGLDVCKDIGSCLVHHKVTYFQESAEKMDRLSDYYDLVFSVATMEHIPNIELAFSEIFRVTKPGGLIYCVASPLWNSYDGHHQYGLFDEYPWIHLRLSKDEIMNYLQDAKKSENSAGIAEFMFSDYFNFTPSNQYVEIAGKLDVSYTIRNDLWKDGEKLLTNDILSELMSKGYIREELLSVAHTFVAIK